jgi:hypothetical protein
MFCRRCLQLAVALDEDDGRSIPKFERAFQSPDIVKSRTVSDIPSIVARITSQLAEAEEERVYIYETKLKGTGLDLSAVSHKPADDTDSATSIKQLSVSTIQSETRIKDLKCE